MKKAIVTFMLVTGIVLMLASEISTTTVVYAKPQTVYVTPTGKKYHARKCGRGKYTKATLSDAKKRGLTVRRHIVGDANRTLISVKVPFRLYHFR